MKQTDGDQVAADQGVVGDGRGRQSTAPSSSARSCLSVGRRARVGAGLRSRPLNISSMRSVTTTPPTMLRVARMTATRARHDLQGPVGLVGDDHGARPG